MFQHVIVPLDGSRLSEQALEHAVSITAQASARVTLLRAFEGAEEPARGYLDRQAAPLRARGLSVDTRAVEAQADEAILAEAAREPDTLVVMSTHGRGALARLVFGSTASAVLQRARGPILLIPVREDLITAQGEDISHDIRISAEVKGTSGGLGAVHRVIVDARTNRVTDLVVRHGFAFGRERVVPLEHVSRIENGIIELDLDDEGFAGMNGFTEGHFHAPDPDYEGPPGVERGTFVLDLLVSGGSVSGLSQTTPSMGFPGGEQTSPDAIWRPSIAAGADILDVAWEKVGEVGELSVEPGAGRLTRLTLRHGVAGGQDLELPAAWVEELSDKGVVLNVSKRDLEALAAQR